MEMTEITFQVPNINQWLTNMGFDSIDWNLTLMIVIKLLICVCIGAVIGWERERRDKVAGLRTHMLVTLGAAIFTLAVTSDSRSSPVDLAQVVKGIAAGIGFLGAGTIIKAGNKVTGLTTAATIWLAASLGLAIGAGYITLGVIGALFTWFVLIFSKSFKSKGKSKCGNLV